MPADLAAWIGDLTAEMSPLEWAVAAVLGVLLLVALIKQLAKTVLLVVLLFGVGVFLLNGRVADWSF